jgi:hypothetical protein
MLLPATLNNLRLHAQPFLSCLNITTYMPLLGCAVSTFALACPACYGQILLTPRGCMPKPILQVIENLATHMPLLA